MKPRYILFLLLAVMTAATSCVYDYNPQIEGEGGYVIVEGDIVIGDISSIKLSYSWTLVDTLATSEERMTVLYGSRMHIEDSNGGRYENRINLPAGALYDPATITSPYGNFDMRTADPSLEYRLVIENSRGTYVSSWGKAVSGGQIDSLSYRISEDHTSMDILVSTHSSDPQGGYYRWSVNETWEYHAMANALFKYVVIAPGEGEILPLPDEERTYRCWSNSRRPEIMTGSTMDLKEDRLVDHVLYTLNYQDERMSVMYSPEVLQMRIPEDAYRYWAVMDRNSHDVGGLFSPEPSELRGNVVNLDNPDEMVLGYVGVMSIVRKKMYIDNSLVRFYRNLNPDWPELDTLRNPADYWLAYHVGKRPAYEVFDENTGALIGYEWWPSRCLDCRMKGGTLTKPEDWPLK